MKQPFLWVAGLLVAGLCVSCGNSKEDSAVEPIVTRQADLTEELLYGLCGTYTTADTLDVIPFGCDPILFDIREAKANNRIYGTFDIGHKVVLRLSEDRTTILGALDITALAGTWVQRDTSAQLLSDVWLTLGSSGSASVSNIRVAMDLAEMRALQQVIVDTMEIEVKSGIDNSMFDMVVPIYQGWELYDGKLVLVSANPMTNEKSYDTLRVHYLRRDSLELNTLTGKPFGRFSRRKA